MASLRPRPPLHPPPPLPPFYNFKAAHDTGTKIAQNNVLIFFQHLRAITLMDILTEFDVIMTTYC